MYLRASNIIIEAAARFAVGNPYHILALRMIVCNRAIRFLFLIFGRKGLTAEATSCKKIARTIRMLSESCDQFQFGSLPHWC